MRRLASAFENSLSRSVHPCTLLDASFCGAKTSPLDETTDLPVRSETTRREHKLTAGSVRNVHPCTFLTCEICIAQISFLRGTTAIHGGTDTLRIVSSGMDATGYIRSDVSATSKLAAKSVQGCTLLAQMCRIFSKD